MCVCCARCWADELSAKRSEPAPIWFTHTERTLAPVLSWTPTHTMIKWKHSLKQVHINSLIKEPTDRLSRKLITEKLLSLKRSGHLSETVYNKIKPRHKQPPRIYGQPKIHKPEIPLRPIVSCMCKHLRLRFVGSLSWHPVPVDRQIRLHSYQLCC